MNLYFFVTRPEFFDIVHWADRHPDFAQPLGMRPPQRRLPRPPPRIDWSTASQSFVNPAKNVYPLVRSCFLRNGV